MNPTIWGVLIASGSTAFTAILTPILLKRLNRDSERTDEAHKAAESAKTKAEEIETLVGTSVATVALVRSELQEQGKKLDKTERRCNQCLGDLAKTRNELAAARAEIAGVHSENVKLRESNGALINAFTEVLPLLPHTGPQTEALRAAIRTARKAGYDYG